MLNCGDDCSIGKDLERKWSWHNQGAVPTFGVTKENQEKYQDFHSTGHDGVLTLSMLQAQGVHNPQAINHTSRYKASGITKC